GRRLPLRSHGTPGQARPQNGSIHGWGRGISAEGSRFAPTAHRGRHAHKNGSIHGWGRRISAEGSRFAPTARRGRHLHKPPQSTAGGARFRQKAPASLTPSERLNPRLARGISAEGSHFAHAF